MMGTPTAAAQDSAEEPTYSMAVRDVPLDRALQTFIDRTRADIAYSTEIVEGRTVYCRARRVTAEELLRCLLAGTGVDYLRTSGGTYLLVEGLQGPDAAGHLSGTVVDASTGEPLPSANVLLADASTGTATNDAGRFTFASVLAGRHRIVVTYVGYATAVDTIRVPADGRQSVRIVMEPRVLENDPLVVDGLQQRLPSASLGKSETAAGAEGGVGAMGAGPYGGLQNASRQVGVSTSHPRADLHVQGGGDGENVTLLDGVPVREPVSLGGLTSAFSPEALDRLVVHKTGFGASYGSYTSGVVQTTHDLRKSAGPGPAVALTADPTSVNGRAELGWGGERQSGAAMVAGRTSVWEAYRAPSLRHMLDAWTRLDPTLTAWWVDPPAPDRTLLTQQPRSHVQFADLHAAVRQELSPFHEVSASAYHGTTELGTTVGSVLGSVQEGGAAPRLLTSEGRNAWDNTVVQARYDWVATGRAAGSLQLYGSRHDAHTFFGLRDSLLEQSAAVDSAARDLAGRLDAGAFDPLGADHSAEGNRLEEAGARVKADVSLSPRYHLEAAVEPQYLRGTFHVSNRFLGALGHETTAWQVGSYAQVEASLGLGTTVTGGTRLTYIPARRSVYAEPRLSVRWDRSETPVGDLAVRVAGGLYRQYVVQSEISSGGPTAVVPSVQFWLPLDGTLAPPRAYHAAGDVLVRPAQAWTLRLETYAKWHPRTLTVDYGGLVRPDPLDDARSAADRVVGQQADLLVAGDGRAAGAALRVQRDGERVSGSVTAEVSRVHRRYPGRFGDRFVPAPWETPLQLSTQFDVRVVEGVHLLGTWQGTWNRPWALRRAYYDYVATTGGTVAGYDLDRPGDQRLAPHSQVDLGMRTETTVRGVTLDLRAHVANVFDRANPFDWSLVPGLSGASSTLHPVPRTLPGRRFALRVGVRF
jgi:hypothetical protein